LTEARFVFLCLEWEMNTKCPAIIFDVRDANELAIDDEGMELPALEAVPQEAAKSLVSTAEQAVWTKAETLQDTGRQSTCGMETARGCNIRG
jgi:hypothetical protein